MKHFSLIFALLICFTLCPMPAQAGSIMAEPVPTVFTNGDYEYILLEDGTAEITRCINASTDITIPDTLDGIPVTRIGDSIFAHADLTSVTIPNGIISIGNYAFTGCSSLTSIILPESLTTIGDQAFSDCFYLTSINIPKSLTSIGSGAFQGCVYLAGITLLDSITSIGAGAFAQCFRLTDIIIPSGVTVIDDGTFASCKNLASVIIPPTVTTIGGAAFSSCTSLKTINLPDSVTAIGKAAFIYCSSLSDINIPDGITTIEYNTFLGCSSLISLTLPQTVTAISDNAFCACSSLTSLTIPDSVTSIGDDAFKSCPNLTVTVGQDSYAAQYCEKENIPYTTSLSTGGNPEGLSEEDYATDYQERAKVYTQYDLNKNLFIGYGNVGFLASGWDVAKITFFNFFDIGETQIESILTGKDYDYTLMRDTIESLIEDHVDYEKNPLEKLLGKKVKDAFKLIKATGKMNDILEKWSDLEYYVWDGEEAYVKLSDPGTREFLRELFYLSDDFDAVRILDNLENIAEAADVIGKGVKYAGWAKEVATPLITDYARHIEALESMKDCDLFGDNALTDRVIDDLIDDYSKSSVLALKALTRIAAEEGFDAVVQLLSTPIGGATGVAGGLASTSLRISVVGAALKGIDLAIDVTGILTGEGSNTDNLQEYFTLVDLQNKAQISFVKAFEKLKTDQFTEIDVINFENSFSLNKTIGLRLCKTEISILKHKYGSDPKKAEAKEFMTALTRQIRQLTDMRLDDISTWMLSDGVVISDLY